MPRRATSCQKPAAQQHYRQREHTIRSLMWCGQVHPAVLPLSSSQHCQESGLKHKHPHKIPPPPRSPPSSPGPPATVARQGAEIGRGGRGAQGWGGEWAEAQPDGREQQGGGSNGSATLGGSMAAAAAAAAQPPAIPCSSNRPRLQCKALTSPLRCLYCTVAAFATPCGTVFSRALVFWYEVYPGSPSWNGAGDV